MGALEASYLAQTLQPLKDVKFFLRWVIPGILYGTTKSYELDR